MILWTIKLINSVRKAIAGRKHPSQLAWGVAFGALVGLIPHGNLLALALVLLVLTLRVNHAMVALVGVGVTLVAPRLDPTFDTFGRWFFEQPGVAANLSVAWQYPLVAWTDLNNTVVMGSFLIGLIALIPLYLLTNPLFRLWAPSEEAVQGGLKTDAVKTEQGEEREKSGVQPSNQPLHRVDSNHSVGGPPHLLISKKGGGGDLPVLPGDDGSPAVGTSGRVYDVRRIDTGVTETPTNTTQATEAPATREIATDGLSAEATDNQERTAPSIATHAPHASRPTRVSIGVTSSSPKPTSTRAAFISKATPTPNNPTSDLEANDSFADDQHKIDEALSYLLRQLRDSQDKDAA